MIRLTLDIVSYGWTAEVFLAVHSFDADAVLACLRAIDCDDEYLVKAEENLRQSRLNRGLTYSNIALRRSVMVVGAASSASECANSLVHELHHLVAHICEGANVDLSSEEACYLAGGLAQLIHNDAAPLLCDCCRKKNSRHAIDLYRIVPRRERAADIERFVRCFGISANDINKPKQVYDNPL